MTSAFDKKRLCDGPVFNLGDACVYGCTFCYVPDIMKKAAYLPRAVPHHESVIRRENALDILYSQLTQKGKGGTRKPKYDNTNDDRVVFSSSLVDIAPNSELMKETAEACVLILTLTHWKIRLLTKSSFLPALAAMLCDRVGYDVVQSRVLFGVSTGTLDNKLAASIELGTPLVSKRLESIHRLQDDGYQTYGMICPSLPMPNYPSFSQEMYYEMRADKMKEVWAEVINVRGESMIRTALALRQNGYSHVAEEIERVMTNSDAWEDYSRATFEAHADEFGPKLRYLQYVTAKNKDYWQPHAARGAVLL